MLDLVNIVTIDDIIKTGKDGVHASYGLHRIGSSNLFNIGQLDEENRHTFK